MLKDNINKLSTKINTATLSPLVFLFSSTRIVYATLNLQSHFGKFQIKTDSL
jgi:hypothetical protein